MKGSAILVLLGANPELVKKEVHGLYLYRRYCKPIKFGSFLIKRY